MSPRWLRALIPVALAIGVGAIEMRVAIGRLEEHMLDVDRRLSVIEQQMPIHPVMAGLEPR
jgi:hypothetical protein